MIGYILFQIPDESFSDTKNCIGIARGFVHNLVNSENGQPSTEAAVLSIPEGYNCVDLSLYKVIIRSCNAFISLISLLSPLILLLQTSVLNRKARSFYC